MKTALASKKFWFALGASAVFALGISVRAAGTPTITIVSPKESSTLTGTSVEVAWTVSDFKLADPETYTRKMNGQGHVHLWLDQETPTKTSAIKTAESSYVFDNVGVGEHALVAELVNNDHSSLVPPVVTTVKFSTVNTPTPTESLYQSSTFTMAVLAFILLVIALYFVNMQVKSTPHSGTRSQKSSPKSSKRRVRK